MSTAYHFGQPKAAWVVVGVISTLDGMCGGLRSPDPTYIVLDIASVIRYFHSVRGRPRDSSSRVTARGRCRNLLFSDISWIPGLSSRT